MTNPPTKPADPRTAVGAWLVALVAWAALVARGGGVSIDRHLADWIATTHTPWGDELLRAVTRVGDEKWMLSALVGLGIIAWRRAGARAVVVFFGAFVVGMACEVLLKLCIPQWRPDAIVIPGSMELPTRLHVAGFPSGHAFRPAFVFGWLARALKPLKSPWMPVGAFLCGVVIGLVGFSRVYLNRHWASDVIGAWLLALVMLSVVRWWEEGARR